jgi:Leucine-rich repeat (LRR) protein
LFPFQEQFSKIPLPLIVPLETCTDYCDNYWDTCSEYNIYLNPSSSSFSAVNSITTEESDLPRVNNLGSNSEAYGKCLETCMKWPRSLDPRDFTTVNATENSPDTRVFRSNLGGDTIHCRELHMSFATSANSKAFHCPHAGNPSAGICRDVLVKGYTPYEWLRDGATTKHRLGYCNVAGDETVADCQAGGITTANLATALAVLPPTIQILFLSGNEITSLGADAFKTLKNMKNIKAVYLNDCKLATVDANALRGLSNLEIFNADSNLVEDLAADFLQHTPNLRQISMFNNFNLFKATNMIPAKFFSHTPNLEVISLYSTAIHTFDKDTFKGLKKLTLLTFVANGSIASFPAGLFDDLVSLQFFDFFGNSISTIPEGFFGSWAKNIIRLALWNNPITSVHSNAGLENLKSIEMAYFHSEGSAMATFDIVPVAEALRKINPMVTLTYGVTQ